ncbi:hypothetical protein WDW37_11370 [Bdellovibrionota bacterium FG-1]
MNSLKTLLISLLFLSGMAHQSIAGTITVPMNSYAKRPAKDLVYQGRRIDENEAAQLSQNGVALWQLDPEESILWKNPSTEQPSGVESLPPEGASVQFNSYLASTRGMFRSSVEDQSAQPFTLTVSLGSSAALMRAGLLRRIGYQSANPRLYRSLTIRFATVSVRNQFLDDLADRSLTSRKRWIKELPADKAEVTLQGVVLEPGRIHIQAVHWGLMSAALQADRRVFRALLIPDVLLGFTEKGNGFAWGTGRVFNEGAVFDYLFSDGFSDVAFDDIKWILARIGGLTREDFKSFVAPAGLPEDISALLLEKVISRRNALVGLVGLGSIYPSLAAIADVNIGNVIHGQLQRDDYVGYPQEFFKKAELPPLRFSQLWRFGAIEAISSGIGALLGQVNERLLTLQSSGTAVSAHQNEVSQGLASYLFHTGNLTGYQKTTGVWAKPTAGAHLNASRNVVAGTYLGSDSQVQLVDTLTADVEAGFYLGWDAVAPAGVGVNSAVTLSRSYSHVRPVQDMNTAFKTSWGKLVVSPFMSHLAGVLNPSIECSISEGPWTSCTEVDGVQFARINYDLGRPTGKEEALTLRAQLIASGTSADRIFLQGNDRKEDCKAEIEKAVDKNLEAFVDQLAVGEMFIITDSVQLGTQGSVTIPITAILGAQAAVQTSGALSYKIGRQTMIRRTSTGFQVYLQDNRLDNAQYGVDFNFFVNVIGYSKAKEHGKADTDFYNLNIDDSDTATKQKTIRSIKALLLDNNAEILSDSFEPYSLHQDLFARIIKFKFLLWKKDSAQESETVDIYPPMDAQGQRNRGDYKRTLAMSRFVTRTGMDWFGFLGDFIGKLTQGVVSLPNGGDPGSSPGGRSFTQAVSTQAEITPNKPMLPMTALEQTYRGWQLSRNSLFRIFDRIEATYGKLGTTLTSESRALFDRSQFVQTRELQLYQIDTTLIFYPEAVEKAKNWLLGNWTEKDLFGFLLRLNGAQKTRIYCDIAESTFGRYGPQIYYGREVRGCAPDWVQWVMQLRAKGLPQDKQQQLGWYNALMSDLVNGAMPSELMKEFDPKSYFFVTRVNGFRKGDINGGVEYLSDTVGKYDSERGLGIYREFASSYGISLFELYGQFFTEGL